MNNHFENNFSNRGAQKACGFLSCGCLIPELERHELSRLFLKPKHFFYLLLHLTTQVSLNWLAQDVTKQTPPSEVQFAIASITKALFTVIKRGGKSPLSQIVATTFFVRLPATIL